LKRAEGLVFKVPGSSSESEGEDSTQAIPIRGIDSNLPVKFAPNGGAVPGDRIIGILTKGEGITIYPIQSPSLMDFDDQPERWLDVRWDIDEQERQRFPAQIAVTAINEPGTLAQIASVIGDNDGNIDSLSVIGRSLDFREMVIDIEVWDLKHLSAIISQLRMRPVVSKVERVNG
jgi:(p)ppGpp synthase/HD superfamily hydrolase